jgi:transposase-like protein
MPGKRPRRYMSQKEYVANHGARCPACRSNDIEAIGRIDADGGSGSQEVRCKACKLEWMDHWKVTSYTVIGDPGSF